MEIWDLYDKERKLLNETMVRGHEFPKDRYHLVVHICIFNKEGQLLIQKRRDDKDGWPGMWDFTAGDSAFQGENSQEAAERETYEEIGVTLDLSQKRPHFTINFNDGYDDFFIINQEIDIDLLKFPTEEVEEIKWANKNEILELKDKKLFIPYKKSMFDFIFDMKDGYGTIEN